MPAPERLPTGRPRPGLAGTASDAHQAGGRARRRRAKGYAHVGFLQTLEEAGYTVDYVGGSSIGGFVATQLALGFGADEVNTRFREAFSAENTGQLFRSPLVGTAGVEALTGLLKEATKGAFFSHTAIPLVIMAVDLTDRIQSRKGRVRCGRRCSQRCPWQGCSRPRSATATG